ncbi:histone-lysine N-methyltransferase PRDM7-like [Schistocerca cancellata]|uniref:histone-lysine N-methyltransferase PRDM7-like n=1 Tax=Schistocerca cancellata TaxID=274614 RepID=UPI002118B32C|nr:histone-lysine N-methyltransferase PRDM7-like [Schistocerca cancellata]
MVKVNSPLRITGPASSLPGHVGYKPVTYELRQRKSRSYREDSSSENDDDYLFCDECNREWFGDCPSHGPLIHIMDTQVPMYPLDPERAAKTLPSIFRIGPSSIRKAGLGVWTTTSLSPRTVLGPFEGSLTDTANDESYCWLVKEKGRPAGFIDASDSSISNWMRFVNCSRHEREQNLLAFQYKRRIYYRTTRPVLPNVELLVWYGDELGKALGIDKKKYCIDKKCSQFK